MPASSAVNRSESGHPRRPIAWIAGGTCVLVGAIAEMYAGFVG